MNIDISKFVARVRHADAILAKLAAPENRDVLKKLHSQCGLSQLYDVYGREVALAHLIPTLIMLKQEDIHDREVASKVEIIRNALAHAGEFTKPDDEKPNVELADGSDEVIFRTRNGGGKEVCFRDTVELASFIAEINSIINRQCENN